MTGITLTTIGPYTVGTLPALSIEHVAEIVKMIDKPTQNAQTALGGRRKVVAFDLSGVGSAVMKHYARGGLIRFLIKERYVRWNATRAQAELVWLEKVRRLGIHAPEPLAFAFKGNRFYTCILITREIKNHQTLADISLSDMARAEKLLPGLACQVAVLVENRIYHVDLHPGNVLADKTDHPWLIDFDKAKIFSRSKTRLRDRYVSRWRRAVLRHCLPESLAKIFQEALVEKII
jgi:3-deoxy-D-manno-octulosonic acid kinase